MVDKLVVDFDNEIERLEIALACGTITQEEFEVEIRSTLCKMCELGLIDIKGTE